MIRKYFYTKWNNEIGIFDCIQTDIDFCKTAIRTLSKRKRITHDILLRPLRIRYFKDRFSYLVRLKYKKIEITSTDRGSVKNDSNNQNRKRIERTFEKDS